MSSLEKGDAIFVQHCGAYSGSCANTFNGRRSGGTVVVRKDGTVLRACPPAPLSAEPLATGYSWGLMSDQKHKENECVIVNDQEKGPLKQNHFQVSSFSKPPRLSHMNKHSRTVKIPTST